MMNKEIVAVTDGMGHTIALLGDGSLVAWGDNEKGQLGDGTCGNRAMPSLVEGLEGWVVGIAAGQDHAVALLEGGRLVARGSNDSEQFLALKSPNLALELKLLLDYCRLAGRAFPLLGNFRPQPWYLQAEASFACRFLASTLSFPIGSKLPLKTEVRCSTGTYRLPTSLQTISFN